MMPLRQHARLKMVQALTIISALQLFSEGVPGAEGSGEPYGAISRGVAEQAARARASVNHKKPREFDVRPLVPALSQLITPSFAPSQNSSSQNPLTNGPISSESDAQKPASYECDGSRGYFRFERLPGVKRTSSALDSDSVSLNEMPGDVLFKCQDFCLKKDESDSGRSLQRCGSVDFIPGKRVSNFPLQRLRYTESNCIHAISDDTGRPPHYEKAEDHIHFRKVCYSGGDSLNTAGSQDCPERLYVMERLLGRKFLPQGFKKVQAETLEKCESMCLHQQMEDPLKATSICRAGSFSRRSGECFLSSHTRRSRPNAVINNADFDYFENTCLDIERRCQKGKLVWMKEESTELKGPYDTLIYYNKTLQECKSMCLTHMSIYCRSIEYTQKERMCILSDEDSISKNQGHLEGSQTDYLELKCLDDVYDKSLNGGSQRNDDRQPLSDRNRVNIPTAFQIYRNRRIESNLRVPSQYKESFNSDLASCLNKCLMERSFVCHSVEYSERRRICRYSEMRRADGSFVFDPDVNYFRNMMHDSSSANNIPGRFRPILFGGDDRYIGSGTNRGNQFSSFGGSFQSGNRFGTVDNRIFGSRDRFQGTGSAFGTREGFISTDSRFGSTADRFGTRGENRFSGAFDRFNANNLGFEDRRISGPTGTFGGGSTGTERFTGADHFSGGNRIGNRGGILVGGGGGDRNRPVGTSSGAALDFNRGGFSSGSGSRFPVARPAFGSGAASPGLAGARPFGFGPFGGAPGFNFRPSFDPTFSTTGGRFPPGSFGDPTVGTPQVSQQCNPDGSMEFMLRSAEPFYGRIYALGYYDRCYYRGGGSTVNMLKLSSPRGFPDCGTIGYGGDTSSNIVVVQFANGVETALDKRYNLTCTTVGPGDTVVTSEYISSGLGAPTPIEYLPERSRMDASVRLLILYSGRPTTTVAVGDPLTFRLEPLQGRGLVSDIFATNVVARDPITGRAVELIDSRGCPVQMQVFPALGKSRSGDGLEARFSAFKIPESTVLVFEANVRMCRRICEPAICTVGPGRTEVMSFGRRRRRSVDDGNLLEANDTAAEFSTNETDREISYDLYEEEAVLLPISEKTADVHQYNDYDNEEDYGDEETSVNEVIRVYMNEEEAEAFREVESSALISEMCIQPSEYYSLLGFLLVAVFCLSISLITLGIHCRKNRMLNDKNRTADASNPCQSPRLAFPGQHPRTVTRPARYFPSCDEKVSSLDVEATDSSVFNRGRFTDPSEPIYTDPTLFEKRENTKDSITPKASSSGKL